jgi:hypothetical protein
MATPTPSKSTETSVMVSLRELRAIETARRADEAMARERAIEDARRRAREAEEAGRAREAAAQAAREAEARRAREAAVAVAREAELRLRETEARARVEADAALATRRLDEEMQLRRAHVARTRPRALFAVLGGLVAVALGLGAFYTVERGRADGLDDQLADARAQRDATAARVAALQRANTDGANALTALRVQVAALSKLPALTATAAAPTVTPPGGHDGGHHGHGHTVHTGGTGTTGTTGTIDLGACAAQPLLCNK